ncbi:hypothetical protein OIU34_21750 [Pararhizobium sp. BT-229]|uniref:hypothetical protein n=1 Tax=Pararhizobium sp. BT-229 TaxID=2986923 RepID=UPI0021F731D6|nr:hypothetical protein [Pararhizobium sp. BT-229]MCV9964518.1 hypothetical protein [Pararhizobium sp. BT-229]
MATQQGAHRLIGGACRQSQDREFVLMRINWIAVLFCGFFIGGGSAYGAQAKPHFQPWGYTREQFRALPALERLSLHNRCMVAAIYAMTDDAFPEKEVKSVFFFHQASAEDVLRTVPYGHRAVFDLNAGSLYENKKIYKSLGWTTVLEATISAEMKPCSEIADGKRGGP